MVESAPHDRKRLLPKAANASEPAKNAKKPSCGANPPSRAVAICSGIAIAARVRPANRSRLRNVIRYEFSERNSGQAFPAPPEPESDGPELLAIALRRQPAAIVRGQ